MPIMLLIGYFNRGNIRYKAIYDSEVKDHTLEAQATIPHPHQNNHSPPTWSVVPPLLSATNVCNYCKSNI